MSEMFFDDDPLGMEFSELPDNDALAADNIVSQTQPQEEIDVEHLQDQNQQLSDSPRIPAMARSLSPANLNTISPSTLTNGNNYVMDSLTKVDGHGMWTSWTRVFDQPRYACLDLLDNCLDATLSPQDFDGKVVMKRMPPNGICLMNNSSKPIKPLKDVLVVYGSAKGKDNNAKRDAIGENGVGLKHGCATLSNTSFVLTRNHNVYSMGVIAKTLQSKEGVCLPSFEFTIDDPDNKTPAEIESELYSHLQTMISQNNPKIAACVQMDLGQGDLNAGMKRLVDHCQAMWDDTWDAYDHVFQVLITSLIHTHDQHTHNDPLVSRRAFEGNNPAKMFLNEIKSLLPKFYINIPLRGFEFIIEGERVNFSYWQHRLVELTKFNVHIPKETPIQEITHTNWDKDGYPLSIYCGFEAQRVADREQANAAHMYIYSRASGRLITIDDDARATLGLAASGSDYQQGLTVIIDDIGAELPLMPTKQGIAWSEQRGGETHKRNLMAWAAGCAHCYWQHHTKTFQNRCGRSDFKTLLQNAVLSFADPIERHLHDLGEARLANRGTNHAANSTLLRSLSMERLELADFTYFRDVDWKKAQNRSSKKWKITKTFGLYNKLDIVDGQATIFKFAAENYPKPAPQAAIAQPQYTAQMAAQAAIAPQPAWAAPPYAKKRRLSNSGTQANQPILLLDDDDDGAPATSPVSSHNRIRARKSTGAPSPHAMMMKNGANPVNPHAMEMQRRLAHTQGELARQKQIMVNAQLQHRDQMMKIQQELQMLQQRNHQLQQQPQQNGRHASPPPPPANYQANLQKAQDELTIVKRQKNKLDEELREIKDQRGTEVSGLNLEIEGLRMKLEQQDETIRRLKRGSQGNAKPDSPGSNGFKTRGNLARPNYQEGTDSI